jgi:pimeloyl-ACP methyl ester carboxylesterase
MKKILLVILLISASFSNWSQDLKNAETISINGKNIYYEVYGSGEPLFLLHGYSLSSKYWLPYISDFQDEYTVYVVDLQGHGKSDVFEENWTVKAVAENLNGLIEYLKLDEIKAIGYSYGGDVLFQLSANNPGLVKSMVTIGAVGSWDIKDYPSWEAFFQYSNLDNFPEIKSFQHDDEHIRTILKSFKKYRVKLSDAQLKNMQSNVLLILGDDDDTIPLAEVARVRKNLPSSDLWILPNRPHGAHEKNKSEFARVSKLFLSKK